MTVYDYIQLHKESSGYANRMTPSLHTDVLLDLLDGDSVCHNEPHIVDCYISEGSC